MPEKIKLVLLVDDNADDNFLHQYYIMKSQLVEQVITYEDVPSALDYLKEASPISESAPPNLILLDLNMPGMNGWDFLSEYAKLPEKTKASYHLIILTTSRNLQDLERAMAHNEVIHFETKPLTVEKLRYIYRRYFA